MTTQIQPMSMFNNYNDLFSTYLDFYRGNFFQADAGNGQGNNEGECLTLFEFNQTNKVVYNYDIQTKESIASQGSFLQPDLRDYLYVALIFFNLLLAKHYVTNKLRQSSYLDKMGLRPKDRDRLDESVWRLIYYTFSSTWLIYSCFFKHQSQSFFDPKATFNSYSFDVTWDEYWICIIECAFYVHSTYALLFEDVWRRDSPMMLLHHLAATFSFVCLYGTRTHRIGLAAVVLRDTCDVLLEFVKTSMCFRIQHDKVVHTSQVAIKCCFSIFTVSFLVNQLYYYPLFCMYHFLNVTRMYNMQSFMWTTQLTCLLIFLLLDLLWSVLILRLLYRMLFTSGSVDDLREYDAHEILEIQRAKELAAKQTKLA